MADEEEQVAPVAESPKPGAGSAQEPAVEEPTDETPESEGGAAAEQEGEAESPDGATILKEVLADLDPEELRAVYDASYDSLPDEVKDGLRPEASAEKAEAQAATREIEQDFRQLGESSNARLKAFADSSKDFAAGLTTEELFDSEGRKAKGVDSDAIQQKLDSAYIDGRTHWDETKSEAIGLQVRYALAQSGIKLSEAQRKEVDALGKSPGADSYSWFLGQITPYLDAAKSSAPEEIQRQATAAAEKKLNSAERLGKLAETLKSTKKKQLASSGAAGAAWSTKSEAASLHVKGKITNVEMRRINSDPTIPE